MKIGAGLTFFGLAIHISSATPGVVFGILGVFIIYITRPR